MMQGILQIALFMVVLLAAACPLGIYMARVYAGESLWLEKLLGPLERGTYRVCGVDPQREMSWRRYALGLLLFSVASMVSLWGLLKLQPWLPLNPEHIGAVAGGTAFNIAASFSTNTNWQNYGGEVSLSYCTQMIGLTVHNFISAAAGMAVLAALIRGLVRRQAATIGNFWVDLTRGTLYILLPLSLVLALALVSQGVVQTFTPFAHAMQLESGAEQVIAVGPAASQIAIKQLGTNGGGFFNTNSAHPLENPTPFSNFLEMLAILLIPAGLCVTFGRMTGDMRQGRGLLGAMTLVLMLALAPTLWSEAQGNPLLPVAGANMEGKETRFGIANSALWAVATTAASNGSVNAMHDSFMPLGAFAPLLLMQIGEVIFGGVGSGLYGMLIYVLLTVFIAGLMVGRTPEYLGKKIGPFEMKMAALIVLIPPMMVLIGTAAALLIPSALAARANPGAHGFSEILYAITSMGNNNGSAFGGLGADRWFYNWVGGVIMLISRFWIAIPTLAIAGALARKNIVPAGEGTLPTHTPLFVALLILIVLLVGVLTFLPALGLGPVIEHLQMTKAK